MVVLLPVTSGTANKKRKLNLERITQEAVDEHGDRLINLNTSINTTTSIPSLKAALALCSNIMCAFTSLDKAQPSMDDDLEMYFGIVAAEFLLADDLSSHRVTKFFADNEQALAHLPYWVYTVLEQVLCGLAELTQDSTIVRAAATGNWGDIPLKPARDLLDQFQRHQNKLYLVTSCSIVLPPVPIYENSSHKQLVESNTAKKRLFDLRLQRAEDDSKKYKKQLATMERCGGGNGSNLRFDTTTKGNRAVVEKATHPDKVGDPVYCFKGHMPQIIYAADETIDCSPFLRQGVAYKFGAHCKFLHTAIMSMSTDKQQRWYQLVLDTEHLDFDWALVPKSLFPLAFQHTNPAVPAAPSAP